MKLKKKKESPYRSIKSLVHCVNKYERSKTNPMSIPQCRHNLLPKIQETLKGEKTSKDI